VQERIDPRWFEFESLIGLGAEQLDALQARGFPTREYAVFGEEHFLYVLNRIAEEPIRVSGPARYPAAVTICEFPEDIACMLCRPLLQGNHMTIKTLLIAATLSASTLLTGCASFYVDTATKEVPVAELKKVEQPKPINSSLNSQQRRSQCPRHRVPEGLGHPANQGQRPVQLCRDRARP
jgi:outer membrane murein-binding lipoprotein Lpp